MPNPSGDYDLSPSKQAYKSLKSDVTPFSAVKELVDNVLDNWRRSSEDPDDLTIDIEFDFEEGLFRIEDDSGGIEDDKIANLFALGQSFKSEIPWSIGAFGMGAKKAIVRLGDEATIKSRSLGADVGYGFKVDEDWLDQGSWNIDRLEFEGLDEETTVIEITDLNVELEESEQGDDAENEGDEEGSRYATEERFVAALREDLSETYGEFLLNRAGPEEAVLEIIVNGTQVEKPEKTDWSFTPFDGFHPRYFKSFQIDPGELADHDTTVSVDVIAGLLSEATQEKAGTDIIIQDRRILTASQDESGGWERHLPNFTSQKRRVKFIVRIRTEEHPENLPWDTQKSHIDTESAIAKRVFNFLKRAGENYASIGYGDIPGSVLSPYDKENEYSWGNSPEELDYSGRDHVTDKPNDNLKQTSALQSLVDEHQELGVFSPTTLKEDYRPAYRNHYDSNRTGNQAISSEDVTTISTESVDFDINEIRAILEWLEEKASDHEEQSKRIDFSGEEPWWRDYYQDQFENWDSCSPSFEILDPEDHIDSLEFSGGLPEPILPTEISISHPDHGDDNGDNGDDNGDSGDNGDGDDDDDGDNGDDNGDGGDNGDNGDGDDDGDVGDGDDDGDNGDNGDGNGDDNGSLLGGEVGGTEGLTTADGDGTRTILLQVPNEAYTDICAAVGLDPEETEPEELGHQVVEHGIDIQNFVEQESETADD